MLTPPATAMGKGIKMTSGKRTLPIFNLSTWNISGSSACSTQKTEFQRLQPWGATCSTVEHDSRIQVQGESAWSVLGPKIQKSKRNIPRLQKKPVYMCETKVCSQLPAGSPVKVMFASHKAQNVRCSKMFCALLRHQKCGGELRSSGFWKPGNVKSTVCTFCRRPVTISPTHHFLVRICGEPRISSV